MLAIVLRDLGNPENLRLEEVPTPTPAPGQVRVRLRAAALNHRDVWIRRGQYARIVLPAILGSDGAGTVDAVGAGVPAARVGEDVVLCPSLDWGDDARAQGGRYRVLGMPDQGTYAQWVCVPAENAVPKPEHLDFTQAAALPLAGLTAWRAVVTQGEVRAGDRVLVTGIGGGVAVMAALISLAHGAQVWVTSSQADKIDRARGWGVRGGVDYRASDWPASLRALAGGDMDVIVDGSVGPSLPALLDVAGYGARLVIYGATQGNPAGFDVRRLFWRQLRLQGTTMGTPAEFRAMLAHAGVHAIVPPVDQALPLERAAAAHARMEAHAQLGKIVLQIP